MKRQLDFNLMREIAWDEDPYNLCVVKLYGTTSDLEDDVFRGVRNEVDPVGEDLSITLFGEWRHAWRER